MSIDICSNEDFGRSFSSTRKFKTVGARCKNTPTIQSDDVRKPLRMLPKRYGTSGSSSARFSRAKLPKNVRELLV